MSFFEENNLEQEYFHYLLNNKTINNKQMSFFEENNLEQEYFHDLLNKSQMRN